VPVAVKLAAALLDGAWRVPAMARRASKALGRTDRRLRALARLVLAKFGPEAPRPGVEALIEFLVSDEECERICSSAPPPPRRVFRVPRRMTPAPGAPGGWQIPALPPREHWPHGSAWARLSWIGSPTARAGCAARRMVRCIITVITGC